jgi:hypothetical protein
MADIDTAHQQERVREQVKAAVPAYRAMLDAHVNNPAQRAAPQTWQAHLRQPHSSQPQSTNAK